MSFLSKVLQKIDTSIAEKKSLQITGESKVFKDILCYFFLEKILAGQAKKVLFICEDEKIAKKTYFLFRKQKENNIKQLSLHLVPETNYWDISSERNNKSTRFQRLASLNFLANQETNGIAVATLSGLLQKTINHKTHLKETVNLSRDEEISPDDLLEKLGFLGYHLSPYTNTIGFFSTRGNIIDCFPPERSEPIRLEFFDDKIVSIKTFSVENQKTQKIIDSCDIGPCWSDSPDQTSKKELRQKYYDFIRSKNLDKKHRDSLLEELSTPKFNFDYEKVSPTINSLLASNLVNMCNVQIVLLNSEKDLKEKHKKNLNNFETLYDAIEKYPYLCSKPNDHFDSDTDFSNWLKNQNFIELCSFNTKTEAKTLPLTQVLKESLNTISLKNTLQGKKNAYNDLIELSKKGYRNILLFKDCSDIEIFTQILENSQISYSIKKDLFLELSNIFARTAKNSFTLTIGDICEPLVDEESQLVFFPGQYLIPKKTVKIKKTASDLFASHDLELNDYVTHEKHGIGQYQGLKKLNLASAFYDFILIRYKNNDNLYVPIEQINQVKKFQKYHEDSCVTLDKLGGKSWQNKKTKIKENVEKLAKALLAIEAKRKSRKGPRLGPKSSMYYDFCDDFPFEETNDQKRAIEEVEADLCSSFPMDRLIVGDVGFGKTEVAMRAAMYSVIEGYQVLFFVPTTVLCEQHYFRFLQRFSKFGITVSCLNRFHKKDSNKIMEEFAEQKSDILIGTHALFSSKLKAKNLGLVILDEEHKMGVAQKKKLKDIAQEANFLTMTATPIPRTLNMSLLGLRDTSLIQQAPVGRLPIKTIFSEKNLKMINNALSFEFERDGQVIYLHNTIENLPSIKKSLQLDYPEIKITIAHGRMNASEIEKNMVSFSNGESKVLLTTTIVESGIDIPNVNTLIVSDCEKYGLAQLHQLRGRVGRSSSQAYAYFFYQNENNLTELAKKRMSAIVTYDGLGSGFHLANTDMSIRGVGNLLGVEQSGDMDSIGIDRYLEMLEEAVIELKTGIKVEETIQPEIRIKDKVGIPESYMASESERVNLYRNLFKAATVETIEEIFSLTKDMYGSLPQELTNLYFVSLIKILLIEIKANKLRQITNASYELTMLLPDGKEAQMLHLLEKLFYSVILIDKSQVKFVVKLEKGILSNLYKSLEQIKKFDNSK